MAAKFWFGKKNNLNESAAAENDAGGGAVVMTDEVFPVSMDDSDESDKVSIKSSGVVLNRVKRNVETAEGDVANSQEKPHNQSVHEESEDAFKKREADRPVMDKKEGSVNTVGNNARPESATVSIPGVVDGAKPGGRPVMTPVRKAPDTAPIKLKSLSETQRHMAEAAERNRPTSALKVVNKNPVQGVKKDGQPKFGLHVNKRSETEKPVAAVSGNEMKSVSSAPADYVKPKSDQRVLYYQLMNGLYDAVLVLDDDGHVVDCNERVKKVLGYTREEAWDLPVNHVIKGMNAQMFAHLKKNLEENHNVLITARCVRSDGDSFKGEIGVSTLSLTHAYNVVFTIRNVDQRRNTMAELRKAASAFDISLASSFACNPEGYFTNVNKTLMDSFGIPNATEALKVRFVDVLPDAARFFAKALNGETIRDQINVTDADGQTVRIEIAFAPIKNGNDVTGVAGSVLPV
ncbi:MAG: PAS domain S-box protein [Kiritimatiellia bacterium]